MSPVTITSQLLSRASAAKSFGAKQSLWFWQYLLVVWLPQYTQLFWTIWVSVSVWVFLNAYFTSTLMMVNWILSHHDVCQSLNLTSLAPKPTKFNLFQSVWVLGNEAGGYNSFLNEAHRCLLEMATK